MSDPLRRLAAVVHRHSGIATTDAQLMSLRAALRRIGPDAESERDVAAFEAAGAGSALIERLIDEVTINETYFYRAPRELEAVPWQALHAAAVARGSEFVHVWVSACATGEEAYTLAMLARQALGDAPPVRILATDISEAVLARARGASYNDRSVAKLPADLYERSFIAERGRHTVSERVRTLVRFERHNLVTSPVPAPGVAAFDVVACRNVLIYFDVPTAERVVGTLRAALMPAGHLILGAADALSGTAGMMARTDTAPHPRRARPRAVRAPRPARPAPPPAVARTEPGDGGIAGALAAANAGDLAATIALTGAILASRPLDAHAHFVRGLAEFGNGQTHAALVSFRRSLFIDPTSGLAAFQLGRAADALGDDRAARRAYTQALTALSVQDDRHLAIMGQVDVADIADACRVRLLAAPNT